jgi:hypothetical protein
MRRPLRGAFPRNPRLPDVRGYRGSHGYRGNARRGRPTNIHLHGW